MNNKSVAIMECDPSIICDTVDKAGVVSTVQQKLDAIRSHLNQAFDGTCVVPVVLPPGVCLAEMVDALNAIDGSEF